MFLQFFHHFWFKCSQHPERWFHFATVTKPPQSRKHIFWANGENIGKLGFIFSQAFTHDGDSKSSRCFISFDQFFWHPKRVIGHPGLDRLRQAMEFLVTSAPVGILARRSKFSISGACNGFSEMGLLASLLDACFLFQVETTRIAFRFHKDVFSSADSIDRLQGRVFCVNDHRRDQ